jgi:hypothetical protein
MRVISLERCRGTEHSSFLRREDALFTPIASAAMTKLLHRSATCVA